MADLIDRDEAINAINGMCLDAGTPQQVWTSDAVDVIKALRPRIKSPTYIKLMPCTCGAKKREHWCAPDGMFLKCAKCGKRTPVCKWETDAHKAWNAMIEEEMQNKQ